jgi:hypothetical protein
VDVVVARTAVDEHVVAVARLDDEVVAGAAAQRVAAGAAGDPVGPAAAGRLVVAGRAVDRVVAGRAVDGVVARASVDRVVAALAEMVDSAARAVRCARIVIRPARQRHGAKEDSASGTDSFGPWRSCAARRVQMAVLVVESAI